MRVVIDGLSIENEDASTVLVDEVLAAWARTGQNDAVHLLLPSGVDITTPRSVTVWRSTGTRTALGQRITQCVSLPRLCRTLEADVLLSVVPSPTPRSLPCPHVVLVQDGAQARQAQDLRDADATVCLSEGIKDEVLSTAPPLEGRALWLVAPPEPSELSGGSGLGSLLQVVDDDLADQLERHRFAWRRVADGLRLALIDAVASTRWRQRRFKIHPVPGRGRTSGFESTIIPIHGELHPSQLPALPAAANDGRHRAGRLRHVSRSGRFVVVASVATLAISGLSAASVVIASAPPAHPVVAAHESALPSPIANAVQTAPTVPVAPTITPSTTTVTTAPSSTVATGSAVAATVPTTSVPATTAPRSPRSPLSLVGPVKAIVPSVALPGLTIPQLPLPALCASSTTTTTTPGLTLPSLCNLSVGSIGLP